MLGKDLEDHNYLDIFGVFPFTSCLMWICKKALRRWFSFLYFAYPLHINLLQISSSFWMYTLAWARKLFRLLGFFMPMSLANELPSRSPSFIRNIFMSLLASLTRMASLFKRSMQFRRDSSFPQTTVNQILIVLGCYPDTLKLVLNCVHCSFHMSMNF